MISLLTTDGKIKESHEGLDYLAASSVILLTDYFNMSEARVSEPYTCVSFLDESINFPDPKRKVEVALTVFKNHGMDHGMVSSASRRQITGASGR